MKKLQPNRWHLAIISVLALITFIPACATQRNTVGGSDIQSLLVQSGFKVRVATTGPQEKHLQSLPEHQFTQVKQNGKSFYVWADKANNRLYCGTEEAHQTYKQNRKAQEERESGAITWVDEPQGIPVTVFRGWAPFREW